MSLSPKQRDEYAILIDKILAKSDIETVSEKKIRTAMAEELGYDVSHMKAAIGKLIGERFDNLAQPSPDPSSDDAPVAEKSAINGHTKQSRDGVKREADDRSPGVSTPPSANNNLVDGTSPPKKKQRKQPDNDAKLAARLQAEENSRARPTRGGGSKKSTPAKKKRVLKKKSAAKIKADDDSDMETGSDGEKKDVVRKGAFHKEYSLSQPLAELVGETQLSRPQVVKKIWVHIKALDLQDPDDKRQILCDDKMFAVFKQDKVHMFTMNKLLGKQLYPLEES